VKVVIWLVEGTWEGCLRSAKPMLPPGSELVLLHVTPSGVDELPEAAAGGLLGRGARYQRAHPYHERAHPYEEAAGAAALGLFEAAARELGKQLWPGRPGAHEEDVVQVLTRRGRPERQVVTAAADAGADLLVVARDGERHRLGPHSLGPATRFVVDHSPCAVLLVWPEDAPDVSSIPPPKHPHGRPPKPPHGPLGGAGTA
jgi:nucleotide-binding universal stress UspA family protein